MKHDRVGKVLHSEMCKKFKFDHSNKWYMYNPAPVHWKLIHKTPLGLLHTNGSPNPGQTKRPYNNQQQKKKKKNLQNC